jgi:PhnB protein
VASRLNPYISFSGNAREAMEFYKEVFGGTLALSTFGQFGQPDSPIADKIMHGMLETTGGFTLMGADTPPDMDHSPGNNMSISLSGADADELRGYWEKLSKEGSVSVPLEKQMWGAMFGACTDRFGIGWMVNIAQPRLIRQVARAPPVRTGCHGNRGSRPGGLLSVGLYSSRTQRQIGSGSLLGSTAAGFGVCWTVAACCAVRARSLMDSASCRRRALRTCRARAGSVCSSSAMVTGVAGSILIQELFQRTPLSSIRGSGRMYVGLPCRSVGTVGPARPGPGRGRRVRSAG